MSSKASSKEEVQGLKKRMDVFEQKMDTIMEFMMKNMSRKGSASSVRRPEAKEMDSATGIVAGERPDMEVVSRLSDSGESRQLEMADQLKTPGIFVGEKSALIESSLLMDDEQGILAGLEAIELRDGDEIVAVVEGTNSNQIVSGLDGESSVAHIRDIQLFRERDVCKNLNNGIMVIKGYRLMSAMGITFYSIGVHFDKLAKGSLRSGFWEIEEVIGFTRVWDPGGIAQSKLSNLALFINLIYGRIVIRVFDCQLSCFIFSYLLDHICLILRFYFILGAISLKNAL